MRKPTRKTTADIAAGNIFPTADTDTALLALQAGSNSAVAGEVLVSVEAAHEAIQQVLDAMADSETKLEYARQRLAYDLWLRHNAMVAVAPSGTVVFLQDLAGVRNRTAFHKYLNELVIEFTGPMLSKAKCTTDTLMRAYNLQQKVYARVSRSLKLIVHLAFMGLNTSAFDLARGQWKVPPAMLVTAGFKGSDDLMSQEFIYLEADTRDEYYFISKPRQAAKAVAPSLTHLEFAMESIIAATHNPAAPTPEDAKRTPRQPVNKDAPVDAPTTVAPDASDDTDLDDDKPIASTDRSHACMQYAAAIIAASKWLATDAMRGVKREDIGNAAFNAMGDVASRYFTMTEIEAMDTRKRAA
jgi:hypothetical protein